MKALGKIHVTVWLLGLAGAALFTILLIRQGLPQVGAAFAAAGWAIAAVVAFHFAVPVFLDALAWWVLFPKSERPAPAARGGKCPRGHYAGGFRTDRFYAGWLRPDRQHNRTQDLRRSDPGWSADRD